MASLCVYKNVASTGEYLEKKCSACMCTVCHSHSDCPCHSPAMGETSFRSQSPGCGSQPRFVAGERKTSVYNKLCNPQMALSEQIVIILLYELHMGKWKMSFLALEFPFPLSIDRSGRHKYDITNLREGTEHTVIIHTQQCRANGAADQ